MDKKLLKMQRKAQEVILAAAVKNNYSIVKLLHADGYRIFVEGDKKDFFSDGKEANGKRIKVVCHARRKAQNRCSGAECFLQVSKARTKIRQTFPTLSIPQKHI